MTTKEAALSSYRYRKYDRKVLQDHSEQEFFALQNLHKYTNIVIQKSDKYKFAVIVDKTDYLDKMENLLNENTVT